MANVLDENVVILRFDNTSFKKNTEDSINSLNKLKASIKDSTTNSGKQFEDIGKAANTINLSSLSKSIDTVNKRFSLLGVAGMAAINKLTSSAMGSAAKLVKAIPKQMISGGWSRALNIEQAKFLIEGLGFVWDKTSAKYQKGMKTVYEAVDNAVTGTRYALDEAAVVASQLMSSGVQDVNELEESLKSISGLASVVGANYGEIGRIFAQVAGQGRMMGDDLLQLQQRGIGAADEIAKYLNLNKDVAQAALDSAIAQGRQVKKMEEIRSHAEITGADVREMVSAGAINFDILSRSFRGLFEQAEKANDTYAGSLANLKSALNRIGQTVENFKLANMTKIFNALLPVVKKFKDYIDPLSNKIGEASSKITDFMINGIINPIGKTIGVDPEHLFKGFGDAVKKAGEESKSTGEKTKDLGNKIRVTTKEWQAALDVWNKGTYGKGQKRADAIRELGMSYENVQGIINKFYKNKFDWEKTRSEYDVSDETKANEEAAKSTKKVTTELSKEEKQMTVLGKVMKGVINFTKAAANTFKAFKNILQAIWKASKGTVASFGGMLSAVFLKVSKIVLELSEKFLKLTEILNSDGLEGLSKTAPNLAKALGFIKSAIDSVVERAKAFVGAIQEVWSNIKSSSVLLNFSIAFKQLGRTIKDGVVKSFRTVSDRFKEFKNTVGSSGAITLVSNAIIKLVGGILNFISALYSGNKATGSFMAILGVFANRIISLFSPIFEWLVDKFFTAGETVVEFFKKLSESEGINKLKNAFGELYESLKQVLAPMGEVTTGLNNLTNSTSTGGLDKVVNFFSKLAGGLADFIHGVASGKHPIEGFLDLFGKVKDGLSFKGMSSYIKGEAFNSIKENILSTKGGVVGAFKTAADTLNKFKVGESFNKAGEGLYAFFSKISGKITDVDFKGIGKQIVDAFKSADWDKISKIAVRFGTLAAVFKTVKDMSTLTQAAAGTLGSISGFFNSLSGISSAIQTQIKMESFRTMATAIAILVGSIVALAMVPTDKLIPALGGVLAMLVVMTGIIALTNSSKFDPNKMRDVGIAFGGMGAGIFLMASALRILAKLKPAELAKGGIVIGAFIAIFLLASKRAGEIGKAGGAFIGMGIALNLLVTAVLAFAAMSWATLLKGGAAILGFTLLLATAAKIAQESKMGGFIGMAVALNLLIPAIIALSMMPVGMIVKGGAAVVGLMMGLALAARIADGGGFKSLAKMAGVIAVLAAATILLSFLDTEKLITSASAITGMMISLAIAAKLAERSAKGLFMMTLMIATLAAAIIALIKIDADSAIVIAEKLGNLALKLAAAVAIFSLIGVKGSFVAGLGLDIFLAEVVAGVGLILAGLSALNSKIKIGEKDLNTFLQEGIPLLETIGEALGGFFGKMKGRFDATSGDGPSMADKFGQMTEAISKLVDNLSGIDAVSLGKLTVFAGAMAEMGKYDMREGIANVLNAFAGSEEGDVGNELSGFADSFIEFSNKLKDITPEDAEIASSVAKVFATFAHAADEMPTEGGWLKKITGDSDIGEFASGFGGIAEAVSDMLTVIKEKKIDASAVDAIKPVVDVLNTFASIELPESGGLVQGVLGNTTIEEFGTFLSSFAQNFSSFKDELSQLEGMDEFIAEGGILDQVCGVIATMVKAGSKIPPSEGLQQVIEGNTTLNEFAGQLVGFALLFDQFVQQTSGIDQGQLDDASAKIDPIVTALTKMAGVKMPDTGGVKQFLGGGQNIDKFAKKLAKFVGPFKEFADKVAGMEIDPSVPGKVEQLQSIIDAAGKIKMPEKSFWERFKENINTNAFQTKIGAIVKAMNVAGSSGTKINTGGITKINTAISKVKTAVASFKEIGTIPTGGNLATLGNNINKFAKKVNSADTSGLASKASEVASSVKSFAKTASKSVSSSGTSAFSKQGKDMGSALAKGITSSGSSVASAAKSLQKKAKNAIDTNALYSTGKNLSEGLARGMRSALGQIRSAADEMERQAERAVRAKAKVSSPSKVFMQIGAFIGEGFVLGIQSYSDKVYRAGNNMAQRSVDAANDAMASLDLFSNPTITPVIDLSEVRKGASQIDAMVTSQRAISVDQNVNAMQSRYSTPNIVNELLSRMNDTLTVRVDSEDGLNGANIVNNITVDGTENPEAFARSFVRSLQQELRTV